MEKDNLVCYKLKGGVIYFCSSDRKNHFVPERNWSLYLKLRHEVPVFCQIFNTIQDARGGAYDFHEQN